MNQSVITDNEIAAIETRLQQLERGIYKRVPPSKSLHVLNWQISQHIRYCYRLLKTQGSTYPQISSHFNKIDALLQIRERLEKPS